MEISELKKKILEKIKEDGLTAAREEKPGGPPTLSSKMGLKDKDILKVFDKPAAIKGIKTESAILKVRSAIDYTALEKSLEEHRRKVAALEQENKKLIEENKSLEKELKSEIEALKKEKEKAAGNIEVLRSKLYAAQISSKEQETRINQLSETLKTKEKKVAEAAGMYRGIEAAKNELTLKLQAVELEKKELQEKMSQVMHELAAKDKKLNDASNLYKKSETDRNEMTLRLQAADREKKNLEGKIAQLNHEVEAKNNRLVESEKLYKELDDMVKDANVRLQAVESEKKELEENMSQLNFEIEAAAKKRESDRVIAEQNLAAVKSELDMMKNSLKEKEKLEAELTRSVEYLKSEIEARDRKIEADMKYCESIVKEIGELRQKVKVLYPRAK